MEGSVEADLRELLASARTLLDELLEEGVEGDTPSEAATTRPGAVPRPEHGPVPIPGDAEIESRTRAVPEATAAGTQLRLMGEAPPWGDRPSLEDVRAVLGDCRRCRLCEGRTQIVFGDGNPHADLMFIGEGPGEQEDLQGIPFCGRAGELLTRMIERGLRIPRSSVYICNIVKCRPPANRTPLVDEVAACRPFLDGQVDAVRPKVIVALGKPAASLLLGRDLSITRVRGTWHEYRGLPVMPTFHPAFLLRQYTEHNRRRVWDDLKSALVRARELGGEFPAAAKR